MSEQKEKKWIRNYVEMVIEEIKDIPSNVRETIPFRQKIATKHQTFFEKFPGILMFVVDQGAEFDMARFDDMLNMMEQIQTGERDLDETNREMGQKYFDKYVAPKIDMDKEKK